MARETAALNRDAIAQLLPAPADRVLEVGFGHGATIAALAPSVAFVAGVDVSETMRAVAARRNRRWIANDHVALACGDSRALPHADASFDKALSVHTIYFWDAPVEHLREIARVLRPGGRLVLGYTRQGTARATGFPTSIYTFYTDDDITQMLRAVGFPNVDTEQHGDASLAIATRASR